MVEDHPDIDWVGNWYFIWHLRLIYYRLNLACTSNELNAAYAADGYARVKEGSLGAVTTTSVSYFLFIPNAKLSTGLVSANCLLSMV